MTCGDAFAEMWAAAGLGVPPVWLTQEDGASSLDELLAAFAAVQSGEQMVEFWRSVPAELEEPLMQAVEARIAQAQQACDTDTVEALQARLDAFRQIRAQAQNPDAARAAQAAASLQEALNDYLTRKETAEKAESDPALWQAAAEAGEAVLSALPDEPGTSEWLAELKKDLASVYNRLGSALDDQSDKAASLTAFERAIALRPDYAMWHRNRAGTLIELSRLDEARQAIARARELEPAAPRLVELEAELAQAEKA